MMLCHGGAGVVHATLLRAAIPLVISLLMGDQFFFAKLVQAKNIGNPSRGEFDQCHQGRLGPRH
jgi:UDP:flavonoid glycosyltransferase YjiC (YdhE family)